MTLSQHFAISLASTPKVNAALNNLEELAAAKVGKEDAIFLPSGTFGNQLALFSHCLRGQEIIIGK
ncbi:beta-eliminating lyase-related protein, partial [Clostridioides difficile]|uniref:beta-eliminating lyase-related protein n=1 Tax=Clostridioides difficile TaxID=1496 RepID=UPI0020B388C4